MNSIKIGLMVALVQVLLIGSIGAKFLFDRNQYPSVWIATLPYDPNLPIRGRYVRLSAVVQFEASPGADVARAMQHVRLNVRDGALVAIPDEKGHQTVRSATCGAEPCWVLSEPLAYFIAEHAIDPSRRKAGEKLWVEATIPPNGPPRPICLGVQLNGKISPLDI
jgi:hypothetical protein